MGLVHPGRQKTYDLFKKRFWFVGCYSWIAEKTNQCVGCSQKRHYLAPKKIAPLRCIPPTAAIMARVHLDLTEGIYDKNGKHYVIAVLVDSFSKFVEGDVLPNKTAKSIALFLWKHLFCRYLAPLECVVHDRDRTLGAKIMKELLKNFDCDIKVTVGGNPQSNGQAEIFIKTIKERINAVLCDLNYELPSNWGNTIFPQVLCGLRCSPSCATGMIPTEILLGRKLKFPFELNREEKFEGNNLKKKNNSS